MKKDLKIDGEVKLLEAVSCLNDLTASLKAGTLTISNGKQTISLSPEDDIRLSIEVSQRKKEEAVALVLSWNKEIKTPKKPLSLNISSTKPAPPAKPEKQPKAVEPPKPKVEKKTVEPTTPVKEQATNKNAPAPKKKA